MEQLAIQTFIGTAGWQFPALSQIVKSIPPPRANMLAHYATIFNSVENNSAFYSFPRRSTIQKWYGLTPPNFVFSIKLNQLFTHEHKLILDHDLMDKLAQFLDATQPLQQKLGVLLIQTPPKLEYNINVLAGFLELLFAIIERLEYKPKVALEFRNQAWFTEEVYALLRQFNIALVMSYSPRYHVEKIATADFTYVRLHGPAELFKSTYSEEALGAVWKDLKDLKVATQFIYFNNTMSSQVIENAKSIQKLSD